MVGLIGVKKKKDRYSLFCLRVAKIAMQCSANDHGIFNQDVVDIFHTCMRDWFHKNKQRGAIFEFSSI